MFFVFSAKSAAISFTVLSGWITWKIDIFTSRSGIQKATAKLPGLDRESWALERELHLQRHKTLYGKQMSLSHAGKAHRYLIDVPVTFSRDRTGDRQFPYHVREHPAHGVKQYPNRLQ